MSQRRRKQNPNGIAGEFDNVRADYEMSRETRFSRRRTGLPSRGNSADWHYRNEEYYYRDIEKARDLDRNDGVVGQTVDRAVDNIVQGGFTLDPNTGDRTLNDETFARWNEWADDADLCDEAGEFTFHDLERQACRSALVDGDCAVLGVDSGAVQFFEAHEIQTTTRIPKTVLGVTKGPGGRHEQFWITGDPETPHQSKEKSTPIQVRDDDGVRVLFHVYNPKRFSQTRGVTSFAPIFNLAGMVDDIQFAKLVQQQIVSCFAVFRERQFIPDVPGATPANYGSPTTENTGAGTRHIENIAPGMEVIGGYGEKLHGFSPNVPNSEFFQHMRLMLQLIGANLGLPLCLVLMDGSETNFSGWRGAVDEARKGFRRNQRMLIEKLHRPLYWLKVQQWLDEDATLRALAAKGKVNPFGHRWTPPAWAYIDPVGDANGDVLRLQHGLTSPRRLHAERGHDWETIADETIEDQVYAIVKAKKAAAKLNRQHQDGQPVHWRELINLTMPAGAEMKFADPATVTAAPVQSLAERDAAETAAKAAQPPASPAA